YDLSDEYPIKSKTKRLPSLIVAHVDRDGKKEVLVATYDAKTQVPLIIVVPSSKFEACGSISLRFRIARINQSTSRQNKRY
ncbi:FG-GAP repeat-containing, partial [Olea europaea subsp. europaea]